LVRQARLVRLARLVLPDLPAPRARLDPRGLTGLQGRLALLELALQGLRDQLALQDPRGRLARGLGEHLGLLARLDRPGLQDPRAQASQGQPDPQAQLGPLVLRDLPAPE
jgi:hypothetical protein